MNVAEKNVLNGIPKWPQANPAKSKNDLALKPRLE